MVSRPKKVNWQNPSGKTQIPCHFATSPFHPSFCVNNSRIHLTKRFMARIPGWLAPPNMPSQPLRAQSAQPSRTKPIDPIATNQPRPKHQQKHQYGMNAPFEYAFRIRLCGFPATRADYSRRVRISHRPKNTIGGARMEIPYFSGVK